jgi:beta-N-acetylhexosaminidase
MGINIDYAPVADVASRPSNPSMGIRSFGSDPEAVSALTRAFVTGLQSVGVVATLKHFPGKGEALVDPHDELPVLDLDLERLDRVEFAPFRAGIEAGARMVMVGHYGLPAITGDRGLPSSVSSEILDGLLRNRLGFTGIVVTDALDMGGFDGFEPEAPLAAGADLLLYGPRQAGTLPAVPAGPSPRLEAVHEWLATFPDPDLSVVGCDEHHRLAAEVAYRSITLVRDEPGLIPIRVSDAETILTVMPTPSDLTPADTSSLVEPGLAAAIRKHHPATTELVVGIAPTDREIADAIRQAREHDLVVVGTIEAGAHQAALVNGLLDSGVPVVTVAMRTPYDLARYPAAPVYLCSYGILPPTMGALAEAMFGATIDGRLPVSIPDLYPVGHRIERTGRR